MAPKKGILKLIQYVNARTPDPMECLAPNFYIKSHHDVRFSNLMRRLCRIMATPQYLEFWNQRCHYVLLHNVDLESFSRELTFSTSQDAASYLHLFFYQLYMKRNNHLVRHLYYWATRLYPQNTFQHFFNLQPEDPPSTITAPSIPGLPPNLSVTSSQRRSAGIRVLQPGTHEQHPRQVVQPSPSAAPQPGNTDIYDYTLISFATFLNFSTSTIPIFATMNHFFSSLAINTYIKISKMSISNNYLSISP